MTSTRIRPLALAVLTIARETGMKTKTTQALALGILAAALSATGRANAQYAFTPIVPCRIVDTRDSTIPSPNGPPSLTNGATRNFQMRGFPRCGIPTTAKAVSITLTAFAPTGKGFASVWPSTVGFPNTSNLNFTGGEVAVSSGAVVMLGTAAADLSCLVANPTAMNVAIDVVGYYK